MKKQTFSRKHSHRSSVIGNDNEKDKKRIARHQKLIAMIKDYRRSAEEQQKLINLRKNTVFEIELRYKRSTVNPAYTFPKIQKFMQDDKIQDITVQQGETVYYDLYGQSQICEQLPSTRITTVRKVKSLDQQITNSQSQSKIIKPKRLQTYIQQDSKRSSQIKLKRTASMNKNIIKLSPLAFPTGINGKKIENIKTEISPTPNNVLQKMISKKLVTETSLSPIKKEKKIKIKNIAFI